MNNNTAGLSLRKKRGIEIVTFSINIFYETECVFLPTASQNVCKRRSQFQHFFVIWSQMGNTRRKELVTLKKKRSIFYDPQTHRHIVNSQPSKT